LLRFKIVQRYAPLSTIWGAAALAFKVVSAKFVSAQPFDLRRIQPSLLNPASHLWRLPFGCLACFLRQFSQDINKPFALSDFSESI
jgi:hypothetical protein